MALFFSKEIKMAKKTINKDRDIAIKNFEGFRFGPEKPTNFIPTGHPVLDQTIASGHLMSKDAALTASEISQGGFPQGKIVMLYGGPGSGKSSLAYRVCGYAQRMYIDKPTIWFDTELSFSENLATINGCDLELLGRYDINTAGDKFYGEAILDKMIYACEHKASVVVLDSVADLVPRIVWENTLEKETIGVLARMLSRGLPKLAQAAAKGNTCVILINQLRTKMGVMWGSPDTTTGGNSLPHASSVIVKMNKLSSKESQVIIEDDNGSEVIIAQTSNCFIEKNRFGQPHKESIPVPVYFRPYFPEFEEILFNAARRCKSISVRNGVYSWQGIKAEGRKGFVAALKESGKIAELVKEVQAVASSEGSPLPPEVINYESHIKTKEEEIEKKTTKKSKKIEEEFDSEEVKDEVSAINNPDL